MKRIVALGTLVGVISLAGCHSPGQDDQSSARVSTTEEAAPVPEICGTEGAEVPRSTQTLSIGNSDGGFTEPYLLWGVEQGCFSLFGIEIESSPGASVEKIAALQGGSLDVIAESATEIVLARANADMDLIVVAGHYEYTAEELDRARQGGMENGVPILANAFVYLSDSAYSGLQDLTGGVYRHSSSVSPTSIGLARFLAESGADIDQLNFIKLSQEDGVQALASGEIDGGFFTGYTLLEALDAGAEIVVYPGAYWYQPGVVTTWSTSQEKYSEMPEAIDGFGDAIRATYALLLGDPKYEADFRRFLVEDYGLSELQASRLQIPALMTRNVTLEELQYLPQALYDDGLADQLVTLDQDMVLQ